MNHEAEFKDKNEITQLMAGIHGNLSLFSFLVA